MNAIVQGCCTVSEPNGHGLSAWVLGLSSMVIGVVILIGFLTPIAGLIATIAYFASGAGLLIVGDVQHCSTRFTALDLAVMSLALVLLGPGMLSLDAYLFGRREIIIPEARAPRR